MLQTCRVLDKLKTKTEHKVSYARSRNKRPATVFAAAGRERE
jgi:hypothetical protein